MRTLMVGAGVIGSFNAARLKEGGQDITLLARGHRLADLHRRRVPGRRQRSPVGPLAGRYEAVHRSLALGAAGAARRRRSAETRAYPDHGVAS